MEGGGPGCCGGGTHPSTHPPTYPSTPPLLQMDIKVEGITLDIMAEALQQAKAGRQHILGEMRK